MSDRVSGRLIGIAALTIAAVIPVACTALSGTATENQGVVSAGSSFALAGANLGLVVDQDLRVVSVEPGNSAENAGILLGDRLVSLDGLLFYTHEDEIREVLLVHPVNAGVDTMSYSDATAVAPTSVATMPAEGASALLPDSPVAVTPQPFIFPTVGPMVCWVTHTCTDHDVRVVIERAGVEMAFDVDLAVRPDYKILPTPTSMPEGPLRYF